MIVIPLVHIVNYSIQVGIYPNSFKKIVIDPVKKNNDPKKEEDYRPVCRINVISKILSFIINKQLTIARNFFF